MTLLADIESIKNDIAGVLQVGTEQVPLSQKELLLFGMIRLLLNGSGGTGTIDNQALADAIANALALKTLTVTGDTVNEAALASAIAGNTQPVSVSSLPLPAGAATSAKQPTLGTAGVPSVDVISVQGINTGFPLAISRSDTTAITEATLTSAGTTGNRNVSGYRHYAYQIIVSGLSTGATATLRLEGTLKSSPASTDWYNLNGTDDFVVSNGTYKFQANHQVDFMTRLNFVSFTSGSPSVAATFVAGN